MKILINGKFLTQRQTGAQRYAREIVIQMDKISRIGELTLAVPKNCSNMPNFKNITIIKVGSLNGIAWEQISLPLYALRKGYTILNLCNVAPLLKPDLSTIFDMKVNSHPHFYGWKFRMWYKLLFANQVKRCMSIFTDSDNAKKEIIKYYPSVSEDKIITAHGSWQHFERVLYDKNALRKFDLSEGQYFFGMGSLEPNKNFRWVAEMAKNNPKEIFAVAGSLNTKVFADGLGFECPKNMKLLGFVSDQEAKTLMRDAKAFLFPSFCEGFGMPPLEALCAGCSGIIVSDIPVMHEIFENNAIYINPNKYDYDINELLAASTCNANSVLNRFSWRGSAQIIYEKIHKY